MSSTNKNDAAMAGPEGWKRREMKGIPASMEALWTTRKEDGTFQYAIQLDERQYHFQGVVHGGVLMSFMDHAMALVIWEAADRAMTSTVQLDNQFLRAVKAPAFIEHEAFITKKGRSLIFARGVLKVDGEAVMESTGVWSILKK